jgi:hypothetical protein
MSGKDEIKGPFLAICTAAGALAVPPGLATLVSSVTFFALAWLGLRAWRWSGLPRALKPEPADPVGRIVRLGASFAVGLLLGLMMLGVIRVVIEPVLPEAGTRIAAAGALPLWRRAAIIFVAAVGEELIFRLIILSLATGFLVKLRRVPLPTSGVNATANALAALAFAVVHLPAWNAAGSLSLGIVLMVLSLNGLAGFVVGHIFVTRGIVAAMWAHAGGDSAIQLIGPLT